MAINSVEADGSEATHCIPWRWWPCHLVLQAVEGAPEVVQEKSLHSHIAYGRPATDSFASLYSLQTHGAAQGPHITSTALCQDARPALPSSNLSLPCFRLGSGIPGSLHGLCEQD